MNHACALMMVVVTLLISLPTTGSACAIPVFRYALERWPSDLFEVDVFHRGSLTQTERAAISALEDRSLVNGGNVNLEVVRCDVSGTLEDDLQIVWKGLENPVMPYVVVRCTGGRNGSPIVWQGSLSSLPGKWGDADPERELVRRILSGDAVVWVVLTGGDEAGAADVAKRIEDRFAALTEAIPLPPGIGLPGSQLMASIPLEVRFSVLMVSRNDASATWLRQTALAMSQETVDDAATLILPVFGRGRALPPLELADMDADAQEELSRFLCGACSCQVKELNPGFDLLLAVNWDEQLFDANAAAIPTRAASEIPQEASPELVAIPAGNPVPSHAELPPSQNEQPSATDSTPTETSARYHIDLYIVSLSILMVLAALAYLRRAV